MQDLAALASPAAYDASLAAHIRDSTMVGIGLGCTAAAEIGTLKMLVNLE